MVTTVTFDFWNTLVREDAGLRDHRLDAWLGLLEGEGIACARDRLGEAFATNWMVFTEHWKANRQFGATDATVGILADLGYDVPAGLRDELAEAFARPVADHHPRLTDNVATTLRWLREAGVRIGIICDVGLSPSVVLRGYLERHGVLELFDHWSFSDEVGVFKPDRRIFEHALAGLGGPDPSDAAHVGDLRRTDVAGARAMGMTAVRYAGVFDDPGPAGPAPKAPGGNDGPAGPAPKAPGGNDGPAGPAPKAPGGNDGPAGPAPKAPGGRPDPVEAHHVITDHAELPAVLGLT